MARPIASAAPSTIALLHECSYRVALRRDNRAEGKRSTPWARLGTASHVVLAAAITGELGPGGDDFDERFGQVWSAAIDVEATAANLDPVEKLWGPPLRWPTYADRKLRTRRAALEIAQERATWAEPDVIVEQRLQSKDGRIYGTPDVVVRRPSPHRVEDFKTGSVLDDEGILRERYRRQILIYAHLEGETSGTLPEQGVVRPLRGGPVVFKISRDDVEAERLRASDAMDAFNAALDDPEQLARPSTAVCRACPYTGRCEPFWEMIEDAPPTELTAVGGTITAIHATDGHGTAVHLVVDEGNAQAKEAAVRGIPTPLAPWLASTEPGTRIRIAGVAPIGGTTASFAPRGMLRVNAPG